MIPDRSIRFGFFHRTNIRPVIIYTSFFSILATAPIIMEKLGIYHHNMGLPAYFALEVLSITLALLVFVSGWNAYSTDQPRNTIMISSLFLCAGLMELFHLLSYDGMPRFVSDNNPHKAMIFYLATRLVMSSALMIAILIPWRPFVNAWKRYLCLAVSFTVLTFMAWIGFFHEAWVPQTFENGGGSTPFSRSAELFILCMLMFTLLVLIFMKKKEGIHKKNFMLSLLCLIFSEVSLFLQPDVSNTLNLTGHLYKIAGIYFVYKTIFNGSFHGGKRAEDRLCTILENTQDIILRANSQGDLLYANRSARETLGIDADLPAKLQVSQFYPNWMVGGTDAIRKEDTYLLHSSGAKIPVSLHMLADEKSSGANEYIITAQDLREQILYHMRDFFIGKLSDHISEGIMITDRDWNIIFVNAAFLELTGYRKDEVIGQSSRILSSGWHEGDFYNEMWTTIKEKESYRGELWNKRKDGDLFLADLKIMPVRDDEGSVTNYIALLNDITSERELEARVTYHANHDNVTDLPTWKILKKRFELATVYAQNYHRVICVMLLDIDQLKRVNRSWGHKAGDHVLQQTAKRLAASVRATDTVSRYSGDEFIVLLPDLRDREDFKKVVKHLNEVLTLPIEIEGREIQITPTIGVCLYPYHGDSLDILIHRAEIALHHAKLTGMMFEQYREEMG